MSSEDGGPDQGESGDGGQRGQPEGGQPQAQGGQPQGGQPQGGQPMSGQPQAAGGGQPQGGYQQQGGAYQESVADIFSKPTTMEQIQAGLVFYALVGLGTGIAGFMFVNQYSSGAGGFGSFGVFSAAFLLGPLLAVPVGLRIVDAIGNVETPQMVYATAGVVTLAGNIVLVLLFRFLLALEVDGDIEFGELIISGIGGGVGAAIVAVGAAYFVLNRIGQ